MGTDITAEDLARDLEAANAEAIAVVEHCTDEQWTTIVPGEQWPVGVVVHHVALGHRQMTEWLGRARRGEAIEKTASEIDEDNAGHARDFAAVTRPETVEALRHHGAALASVLRSLTAAELATSCAFGPGDGIMVTTERVASVGARHCRTHLADVRNELGQEPTV